MLSKSSFNINIKQQVEEAISVLRQGGIVAFPTDTVYGLGASMNISWAVERIYQVKERPRNMALPLLLADRAQITKLAKRVPPIAWQLIENFLPGALTIVLLKSKSVPELITAGGETVAIRIPNHPIPIALIEGVGAPIIGTSANVSGKPNPLTAGEVYSQFSDKIDIIIDGGRCPGGSVSTVVDVTGDVPIVLREGAISREKLKHVCENIVFQEGG